SASSGCAGLGLLYETLYGSCCQGQEGSDWSRPFLQWLPVCGMLSPGRFAWYLHYKPLGTRQKHSSLTRPLVDCPPNVLLKCFGGGCHHSCVGPDDCLHPFQLYPLIILLGSCRYGAAGTRKKPQAEEACGRGTRRAPRALSPGTGARKAALPLSESAAFFLDNLASKISIREEGGCIWTFQSCGSEFKIKQFSTALNQERAWNLVKLQRREIKREGLLDYCRGKEFSSTLKDNAMMGYQRIGVAEVSKLCGNLK
ncbi:Uncharacterized protein PODLI_1B019671, partial [Podarcis lilfordi]